MDHEAALEAANQALSGRTSRSARIKSVELTSVDASRRNGRALPSLDARPKLANEAWQVAAAIGVAVITLAVVISLWLL